MKAKYIAPILIILSIVVCIISYNLTEASYNKVISTNLNISKKHSKALLNDDLVAEKMHSLSSKPILNKKSYPPTNKLYSTGNFTDLINGSSYMIANIEGVYIYIPLSKGIISNNILKLPEYYSSRLNEEFSDDFYSLGNNKFLVKEYFNNRETGIFNLKYNKTGEYGPTLSGSFNRANSNVFLGVTFYIVSPKNSGLLSDYPFYTGTLGGTRVTIATEFPLNNTYIEKYANDNNLFTLSIPANGNFAKYTILLNESFNNKITGEYKLNKISNSSYSGVFIHNQRGVNTTSYIANIYGTYSP